MTQVPNNPLEQLPEDLQGWSADDLEWLKMVPEMLQPVARRHGRWLFSLTMQNGRAQHAAGIVARQGRGNRALHGALQQLVLVLDDLTKAGLAERKLEVRHLMECRKDIEVAASLAQGGKQLQPGDRVSPGGILLNS